MDPNEIYPTPDDPVDFRYVIIVAILTVVLALLYANYMVGVIVYE